MRSVRSESIGVLIDLVLRYLTTWCHMKTLYGVKPSMDVDRRGHVEKSGTSKIRVRCLNVALFCSVSTDYTYTRTRTLRIICECSKLQKRNSSFLHFFLSFLYPFLFFPFFVILTACGFYFAEYDRFGTTPWMQYRPNVKPIYTYRRQRGKTKAPRFEPKTSKNMCTLATVITIHFYKGNEP
jgi:hypothetical protein